MKYISPFLVGCLVGATALEAPRPVHAQYRPGNFGAGFYSGAMNRPAVSPYLSVGTGGGMNYFNIVRPQLETRSLLNRQSVEIQRLEERRREPNKREQPPRQEEFSLPKTGHRAYFSTLSHYYPQVGR